MYNALQKIPPVYLQQKSLSALLKQKLSPTCLLQKLSPAYVLQKLLTDNCNRNSHLLNCNRKIHQHTSNKRYHLKTCMEATDVITCIIAPESVSCIVPAETSTCRIDYRKFHLEKWCLSGIRLAAIKKLSKLVTTKFKANSFSIHSLYHLMEKLDNELIQLRCILVISIFNFLIFIHFANQITLERQKLKLIFKFSTIVMTDKGFALDPHGV